ncbi:MAG TPA: sulfurtransferase [Anaerolineaceae bacterium]|nr:sulfurtransferase [Anaerolineaceae bacterium]
MTAEPIRYSTIISTQDLNDHLEDARWAIVDCRFDLLNPSFGFQDYQIGHIPGAVYAHLNDDLSSKVTPETGRHPLPDPAELVAKFSHWGIDKETRVVVYDTAGGSFAVRLWWLLKRLGHPAVAVLDGGLQKWTAEDRSLRSGIETRPAAVFEGSVQPGWVANAEEVEAIRNDAGFRLIDARSPARFWGEEEPIDPVAGHIPGAVNRFHGDNLNAQGTFKSPEALREEFSQLLSGISPEKAVVYCGSGVTSLHHLLAMEIAGLPGARVYAGSWSEWIRDPRRARSTCVD